MHAAAACQLQQMSAMLAVSRCISCAMQAVPAAMQAAAAAMRAASRSRCCHSSSQLPKAHRCLEPGRRALNPPQRCPLSCNVQHARHQRLSLPASVLALTIRRSPSSCCHQQCLSSSCHEQPMLQQQLLSGSSCRCQCKCHKQLSLLGLASKPAITACISLSSSCCSSFAVPPALMMSA